jgi:hypothetical protein
MGEERTAEAQRYVNLAQLLREEAEGFQERRIVEPERLSDVTELIRVLARLLEGKEIHKAFGAPGDWGYSNPIGKALAAAYRIPGSAGEATKELSDEAILDLTKRAHEHGRLEARKANNGKDYERVWDTTPADLQHGFIEMTRFLISELGALGVLVVQPKDQP